jgi:hypothetical protein
MVAVTLGCLRADDASFGVEDGDLDVIGLLRARRRRWR